MREVQGVVLITPWYPRLYPLLATWLLICQPCKHHSQRVIPDDCGTASPLQLVFKPSDALGRP